jgi:hygromycin-B 7''-O-kinase
VEHTDRTHRAQIILQGLGLPDTPLVSVESHSNAVWLTRDHAVHYHIVGPAGRLEHEARVALRLAPEALYPAVVAVGRDEDHDWLVTQRMPGIALSAAWPWLTPDERRDAMHQTARALRALHHAPALEAGRDQVQRGVPVLTRWDFVSHLQGRGIPLPREWRMSATDGPLVMAHGDFSFNQILWHEGRVTALLDLEMAHAEAPDWDLGTFLAFCHDPVRMVPTDLEAISRPEDYRDAPVWLREAYPELFAFPALRERLALQALVLRGTELLDRPSRWEELRHDAVEWARAITSLLL